MINKGLKKSAKKNEVNHRTWNRAFWLEHEYLIYLENVVHIERSLQKQYPTII